MEESDIYILNGMLSNAFEGCKEEIKRIVNHIFGAIDYPDKIGFDNERKLYLGKNDVDDDETKNDRDDDDHETDFEVYDRDDDETKNDRDDDDHETAFEVYDRDDDETKNDRDDDEVHPVSPRLMDRNRNDDNFEDETRGLEETPQERVRRKGDKNDETRGLPGKENEEEPQGKRKRAETRRGEKGKTTKGDRNDDNFKDENRGLTGKENEEEPQGKRKRAETRKVRRRGEKGKTTKGDRNDDNFEDETGGLTGKENEEEPQGKRKRAETRRVRRKVEKGKTTKGDRNDDNLEDENRNDDNFEDETGGLTGKENEEESQGKRKRAETRRERKGEKGKTTKGYRNDDNFEDENRGLEETPTGKKKRLEDSEKGSEKRPKREGNEDITGTRRKTWRKDYILNRSLISTKRIDIKGEMPDWPELNGGENNLFTDSIENKMKAWVDATVFKFHYLEDDLFYTIQQLMVNGKALLKMKKFNPFNLNLLVLDSLKPGKWIVDDIINQYSKLLLQRETLHRKQSRFYIFETFFYQKGQRSFDLMDSKGKVGIGDWPKFYVDGSLIRDKERFGEFINCKYLIFPACNGSHFILLIFNMPEWELLILDSLDYSSFQKKAAHFVITVIKNILHIRGFHLLKRKKVQCYVPKNIPRQDPNSGDCGVYAAMFLRAFMQGLDLRTMKWSNDDIKEFRYKLAAELVKEGRLLDD